MTSIVTANRLRSGEVVYLAAGGRWSQVLADAQVASGKSEIATLEAIAAQAADARDVTAVYAMDVALVDGRPVALSVREKIRAALGPTV